MGLPLRVGCPVRVCRCRAASRRARDAQSPVRPVVSLSVFVQNTHLGEGFGGVADPAVDGEAEGESHPGGAQAFANRFVLSIASPEARAVLGIAPTPAAAAKLSVSRIAAALRRAGRTRGIDQTAAEIKAGLRKPQLRQPHLVETAMGKNTMALLAALDTACVAATELGRASAELFQTHPDYAIVTSPSLADSTGARVLAEIGDDRARFVDARALKAYAGSAPITRASGRSISVTHRHINNNRLANVGCPECGCGRSPWRVARRCTRRKHRVDT